MAERNRFVIALSDLPGEVRLAYVERECARVGLPAGTYDAAAHDRLMAAPAGLRARAERRAELARALAAARAQGLSQGERFALVRKRFGAAGTSRASLQRIERAVAGVDPINWAPALLEDHGGGPPAAPLSAEAWEMFLKAIRRANGTWPLKSAWRDVRDVAAAKGWDWPSFVTVFRRWQGLTETERLTARLGPEEAARRLAMPALRDKATLAPLEWASLDGRTLDFWVDFGDGRAVRPVMLALVDVASGFILGYEMEPSENAAATVRLIKGACARFGIFDRLYTDNGAAFAGHLVAGGAKHRFRRTGQRAEAVRPLGICHHLGIELRFALPKNAQAKAAERTFATLSRAIDDRPEFAGAHAGHAPGAAPGAGVVPVPIEVARAVIAREVARHNGEPGRRGSGMAGRSYQAPFEAGLEGRTIRRPTARQLYLAGLIYKPATPDRFGRVTIDGWVYGGPETQDALLAYRGERILVGRDPDDLSAPALAWNAAGRLICEGIEAQRPGAYGSTDGIRMAARNRKAARAAVRRAEEKVNAMDTAAFEAALAAIPTPPGPAVPPGAVVAGQFGGTLDRAARPAPPPDGEPVSPEQFAAFLRNYDRAVGMAPGT